MHDTSLSRCDARFNTRLNGIRAFSGALSRGEGRSVQVVQVDFDHDHIEGAAVSYLASSSLLHLLAVRSLVHAIHVRERQ